MPSLSIRTGSLKFALGWLIVLLIRLVPFRPPNVEPTLAVVMPFGKRYDVASSFLFGFLGIAAFDLITGTLGLWTLITGTSYGLLGVGASYFFRTRAANIMNFVGFGVVGTIAYDAITGLTIGPLFYGQSFINALVGQIPFTLMHLAGTIGFSIVLSPLVYRWVVRNDTLEIPLTLQASARG